MAGETWTNSGSAEGKFIDWLTFKELAESVYVDVKCIRNHTQYSGLWLYLRCQNGQLIEVPKATEVGKAIACVSPLLLSKIQLSQRKTSAARNLYAATNNFSIPLGDRPRFVRVVQYDSD